MKKVFGLIILVAVVIFAGKTLLAKATPPKAPSQQTQQQITQQKAGEEQQPTTTQVAKPQTLSIPKLGVNASIESVGMDSQGRMDVPSDPDDVAWYNLGFKPGQQGSAVIDGHFDKPSGAPAVFYDLAKLQAGDTLVITDTSGQKYTFAVTESKAYPFDSVPLQTIFDSTDKPRLNLITCDGVWNKNQKNYSQRLVVYAELQQ
jgi:sortase (surface protein transpeptidase)